jgi:murein DD-endopeptidase MepM/ murein hydrolase activator NlpD
LLRAAAGAFAIAALLLLGSAPARADRPQFILPLACTANVDCFVQTYFDHDPTTGIRDYACGNLVRDKHNGIDIRLPNYVAMERGIAVLAAAAGTVWKTRDGIEDINVLEIGKETVDEYGLGNTVFIDHGDGWVSIYGHMRKGSVGVKPGDHVEAGQPIGLVGLSGLTSFPHVHFMVHYRNKPVDPFTGVREEVACGDTSRSLWAPATLAKLAYTPTGFLTAGFADREPEREPARNGAYDATELPAASTTLTFWIDFFGQQKGDQRVITLYGPKGEVLARSEQTAEEKQDLLFRYVGKRAAGGFPPGIYRGEFILTRVVDGGPKTLIAVQRQIELR